MKRIVANSNDSGYDVVDELLELKHHLDKAHDISSFLMYDAYEINIRKKLQDIADRTEVLAKNANFIINQCTSEI